VKTVRLTLDEGLIAQVDLAASRLNLTRSAFIGEALSQALERISTLRREAEHRRGYAAYPAKESEFSEWATEQAWP
jgi:metal-responsive CopG/Arc/MetJ family transcriptional regulator